MSSTLVCFCGTIFVETAVQNSTPLCKDVITIPITVVQNSISLYRYAISGLSGFRALHNELLEVLQVPYSQSGDKEQFARQVTVNSFENVINMSFIYFSKVVPDTITEFLIYLEILVVFKTPLTKCPEV